MYYDNYELLKKQLKVDKSKKTPITHNININSPLLPFGTRNPERPKFKNGFKGVIGEFARLNSDKEWDNNLNSNNIVQSTINNPSVNIEEGCEDYLKVLIKEYIIGNDENLNIIHPHLFLYLPQTEGKQEVGEYKLAKFLNDVFFKDIPDFNEFFNNKESNHLIIQLILNNLPDLNFKKEKPTYIPKLDYILTVFKEDMMFLLEGKEDFLIKSIDNILAYYYFYYITQLSLKLSKKESCMDENEKLYYLLDSESANKNRKSTKQGYSIVKIKNRNLLSKINTVEHINTLLGTHGLIFSELNDYVKQLTENDREDFIKILGMWINEYRNLRDQTPLDLGKNFPTLYKQLFDSINDEEKGVGIETKSRYALYLEEIGKKYFLKSRGKYGNMLNINQETLLNITALCIKDEKILLKQLFKEYERRGLYFDNYSKEEIIKFFNKLNLIDKKSDSGDAQYVKRIL